MTFTTIIDYITKAFSFIKENISKVYLGIIYFQNKKIADLEKVNDALSKENENTKKNLDEKKRLDKITNSAQDKIDKIKKPLMIFVIALLFSSCTTTKIVYRTDFIKPILPILGFCTDNPLSINGEAPKTEAEIKLFLSCVTYYEQEIREYNNFVAEFNQEVPATDNKLTQ